MHQDLSLIYKTIRDVFGSDVNKMIIDSPVDYEKAARADRADLAEDEVEAHAL